MYGDDVTGIVIRGRGLREPAVGVTADAGGATVRADCHRGDEYWVEVRLSFEAIRDLYEAVVWERADAAA